MFGVSTIPVYLLNGLNRFGGGDLMRSRRFGQFDIPDVSYMDVSGSWMDISPADLGVETGVNINDIFSPTYDPNTDTLLQAAAKTMTVQTPEGNVDIYSPFYDPNTGQNTVPSYYNPSNGQIDLAKFQAVTGVNPSTPQGSSILDTVKSIISTVSPLAIAAIQSGKTQIPATSTVKPVVKPTTGIGASLAGLTSNLPLLAILGLGAFLLLGRRGGGSKKK